jgi:hypothetical protein
MNRFSSSTLVTRRRASVNAGVNIQRLALTPGRADRAAALRPLAPLALVTLHPNVRVDASSTPSP